MRLNDGRKRKQISVRFSFTHLVPGFPDNQSCDIISQMSAWTTDTTHDLKSGVGGGSSFLEKLIIIKRHSARREPGSSFPLQLTPKSRKTVRRLWVHDISFTGCHW
jgi:hypothetical protein